MRKNFKDNQSYLNFINTYKEKIKVMLVRPIIETTSDYTINVIYELKG